MPTPECASIDTTQAGWIHCIGNVFRRVRFGVLVTLLVIGLLGTTITAHAVPVIFVANAANPPSSDPTEPIGYIGEYTASGATVNADLISGLGLSYAGALAVSGSDLFVSTWNAVTGTIAEYTTGGALVNPSLISFPCAAEGIAISGSNIFVSGSSCGTVGEYTTSGSTVNANLISGLIGNEGIAISGSEIFIVENNSGVVAEYTTSGTLVNPGLVTGLCEPTGIALSGSDMFTVGNSCTGAVGEYTTSGTTVNSHLIPVDTSYGIGISGSDLFDAQVAEGTIGEFTTSGATVNADLISGLDAPVSLVIASVPEPTTWTLFGGAFVGLLIFRRRRGMSSVGSVGL